MKKTILTASITMLIFVTTIKAQVKEFKTIKIKNLEWMTENLNVVTYQNGDTIPQVQDAKEWKKLKTGAWCYYENDTENGKIYGKLYNWYAVNDPRGLAPKGWHIPNEEEWKKTTEIVENKLNDLEMGAKLKSKEGWKNIEYKGRVSEAKLGTDIFGFNGKPGGYRYFTGNFEKAGMVKYKVVGTETYWWSSTSRKWSDKGNCGISFGLESWNSTIWHNGFEKNYGCYVRCVKD